MDPKGKGMVVDNEKESIFNEPKNDKYTDLGSSHKRKDRKKKKTRRIKEIIYYDDSDESSSSKRTTTTTRKRKRSIQTFLLIILVFRKAQMLIYSPFHLVNLLTLMERTTNFGVTKCVLTYFLSIQAFGR